jgi:hypothetical protein
MTGGKNAGRALAKEKEDWRTEKKKIGRKKGCKTERKEGGRNGGLGSM